MSESPVRGRATTERAEDIPVVVDLDEAPWLLISAAVPGVYSRGICATRHHPAGLRVHLAKVDAGHRFPKHAHTYPQVFIFVGGRGHVDLAGEWVTVRPGIAIRMAKDEPHEVVADEGEDLLLYEIALPNWSPKRAEA